MAVIIKHTIMISVILLMFGVRMNTSLGQIISVFRQFGAVLREFQLSGFGCSAGYTDLLGVHDGAFRSVWKTEDVNS